METKAAFLYTIARIMLGIKKEGFKALFY